MSTVLLDEQSRDNAWVTLKLAQRPGSNYGAVTFAYDRKYDLVRLIEPMRDETVRPGTPGLLQAAGVTLDAAATIVEQAEGSVTVNWAVTLTDAAPLDMAVSSAAQDGPRGKLWQTTLRAEAAE